jgi:hypothetical protein
MTATKRLPGTLSQRSHTIACDATPPEGAHPRRLANSEPARTSGADYGLTFRVAQPLAGMANCSFLPPMETT